jgi:hypothetical protein
MRIVLGFFLLFMVVVVVVVVCVCVSLISTLIVNMAGN